MGELPLLLAREFGEREVERGDEEERIVSEAGVASGMVEELAFDGAMGAEEDLAVAGEGQGADEAGGPGEIGECRKEREQGAVVAVVFGAGVGFEGKIVCEAGGADAGLVFEGGDFEAGVVGEDHEIRGGEGVGDGFEIRVALEGGGVFDGLGDLLEAGESFDGDIFGEGRGFELEQLAGVGGGGVEGHKGRV